MAAQATPANAPRAPAPRPEALAVLRGVIPLRAARTRTTADGMQSAACRSAGRPLEAQNDPFGTWRSGMLLQDQHHGKLALVDTLSIDRFPYVVGRSRRIPVHAKDNVATRHAAVRGVGTGNHVSYQYATFCILQSQVGSLGCRDACKRQSEIGWNPAVRA